MHKPSSGISLKRHFCLGYIVKSFAEIHTIYDQVTMQ